MKTASVAMTFAERLLRKGDFFYTSFVARLVRVVGLGALDLVDDVHPVDDLPEDRVLAVEPRRRVGGDDEELAAVRVRAGVRHRERAAHDLVVVELVLERVARAAAAGPGRVAALDHEVLDHAVEDHAVVEVVAGELLEVLDGLGGVLVEQLDRDVAVVGVHDRCAAHRFTTSAFHFRLSATSEARASGTSTSEKRSSTRTLRTSSFSRCVWSTIAATTSFGSTSSALPARMMSLTEGPLPFVGFVWRGRRASRSGFGFDGCGSAIGVSLPYSTISVFACFSMTAISLRCFDVTSVIARPERPTRPVRPMRCT